MVVVPLPTWVYPYSMCLPRYIQNMHVSTVYMYYI